MSSSVPLRHDTSFVSGGDTCGAWLYPAAGRSAGDGRSPVIVMAHGLGAVKALRLAAFAERFQAAGYTCLVFDYRYFGDSTGEPRELLSVARQREDWRAAVAFARSLPNVDPDRVVVWGTSFGGGHAIVTAANDSRLAAVIAQCPFTDGWASSRQLSARETARLSAAMVRDNLARLRGRPPVRVKVAARPGEIGLMSAPDVVAGVRSLLEASGMTEDEYRNDVPARVGLEIMFDRPGRHVAAITQPILFCVADEDSVAPPGPTLRHAARAKRAEIRRYPGGHFDIYTGELFERLIDDQLQFLTRHVGVAVGS